MKIMILILFSLLFIKPAFSQIAVISHSEVVPDSISKTQLLDFYSGEIREWENEQEVVVFDLGDNGGIRDSFFVFIGKSSSRMRSIWLKKMLMGEWDPPAVLKDEEQMITKVAKTPGAIGFVSVARVNDKVKKLIITD